MMADTMFSFTRTLLGAGLTAQVLCLAEGIQVNVYGGTRSHIGAVSIADPQGTVTTMEFPSHKDGIVSKKWAETFAQAGIVPAVVCVGIHYDNLRREDISAVVAATDDLLCQVCKQLHK